MSNKRETIRTTKMYLSYRTPFVKETFPVDKWYIPVLFKR